MQLSFVALLVAAVSAESISSKPNILYIVADDMGWADVDWHAGPDDARPSTPRLTGLSAAGVRLESFYTQPICAATRSSILTGRYVTRLGFQHLNPPAAFGGVGAIPLTEKLLPEYMHDAGYTTHHVGKWHGGMIKDAYLPQNRGFDTSFGYYEGAINYYNHTVGPSPILDLHDAAKGEEAKCQPQYNGTYDLDLFAERAQQVISAHDKSKPLFMYLALHSVHDPDECPKKWYDMYKGVTDVDNRRTMCGMVSAMDTAVGEVVDHLQKTLGNNSVVLFHSDNGGPTYAGAGTLNYPLRGGKLTLFEGGMRVNAFAWSPLISKPGRTENGLVHITDVLPTLAAGLGGTAPTGGRQLDGYNMWDMISQGLESPRHEILHLSDPLGNAQFLDIRGCNMSGVKGSCQNSSAIRKGDWKLIVGMFAACVQDPNATAMSERFCGWHRYVNRVGGIPEEPAGSESGYGVSGPPSVPEVTSAFGIPVALFNITADPEERHELSNQHAGVVQSLLSRLADYHSHDWLDPQWPPYKTCDTPDKACTMKTPQYIAAAMRRGCCGPFVGDSEDLSV